MSDRLWPRVWRKITDTLRRDFVAGLLVFVPVGFTILGVLWIVNQLDKLVLPRLFRALGLEAQQPPFVGALATILVILVIGAATRSFIGRSAVTIWERIVERIPVARSIYAVLKQFMQAIVGEASGAASFDRVVLFEYPRKGIYTYAFVTGLQNGGPEGLPSGMTKVFVSSTPNPTTGYFLLVPSDELIDTNLSVEEAFKLIISAGIADGPATAGAS
ncbi:MAG: DUF502 domain-containing protein [bacterium]|nr:DUF502 domain-containing protein [bacterium]